MSAFRFVFSLMLFSQKLQGIRCRFELLSLATLLCYRSITHRRQSNTAVAISFQWVFLNDKLVSQDFSYPSSLVGICGLRRFSLYEQCLLSAYPLVRFSVDAIVSKILHFWFNYSIHPFYLFLFIAFSCAHHVNLPNPIHITYATIYESGWWTL